MEKKITSSVAFKSNLQVFKSTQYDPHFLSSIHDPFALELMKRMGHKTIGPIQEEEFRHAALHCSFAFKDDYPWGTVVDSNGNLTVVCKCTNTGCGSFKECRRDGCDKSEINAVREENKRFKNKVREILAAIEERKTLATGENRIVAENASKALLQKGKKQERKTLASADSHRERDSSAVLAAILAGASGQHDANNDLPVDSVSPDTVSEPTVAARRERVETPRSEAEDERVNAPFDPFAEFAPAEPETTESASTESEPAEPASAEPVFAEPEPTEPALVEPVFAAPETTKDSPSVSARDEQERRSHDDDRDVATVRLPWLAPEPRVPAIQEPPKSDVRKSRNDDAPVKTGNAAAKTDVVVSGDKRLDVRASGSKNAGIPNTKRKVQPASFDSFKEVEQADIIDSAYEERTVVNAGPGTGKTWTLIEKIKRMLSTGDVEPENILVLCFSRAAVEVIRTRLEAAADNDELPLNWRDVDVRTFDSFATYLLSWAQENKPDVLPQHFALEYADYDRRIVAATHVIKNFHDLLAEYQHVIVDEVQDLVGVRAEMVLALLGILPESCGFTILGDSCQSLYDYLAMNDSSVMDSKRFYYNVFCQYPTANYFALTHNWRQGDKFGELTIPYRKAILTGEAEDRTAEATKLWGALHTGAIKLKDFSEADAARFRKTGTLGILTRTNGQALQISSSFRTKGIRHALQRSLSSQELGAWICATLTEAETDVIDRDEFSAIFARLYPRKTDADERFWDALTSTQPDPTQRHFEIADLLRGIMRNARNPLLFCEPVDESFNITISNIHRAKGREFDSVLVLDDVIAALTDEEADDMLEHKVCYVALTRPKKKLIKALTPTHYIYISKDEKRRCFEGWNKPGKKGLKTFEVGDSDDFDARTFASDGVQEEVRRLREGAMLQLLRCPEKFNGKPYVLYKIVSEEDESITLGYTTESFAHDVEKAIQRIFGNRKPVAYKYYPEILDEIYFNGRRTCVSTYSSTLPGAKRFGDMCVWYGLNLSGFAKRTSKSY